MSLTLTAQQERCLVYLEDHLYRNNTAPSFEEIRQALGLASKNGVHRLLTALEKRGRIRRIPYVARCLEIIPQRPPMPSDTDLDGVALAELYALDFRVRAAIARRSPDRQVAA